MHCYVLGFKLYSCLDIYISLYVHVYLYLYLNLDFHIGIRHARHFSSISGSLDLCVTAFFFLFFIFIFFFFFWILNISEWVLGYCFI